MEGRIRRRMRKRGSRIKNKKEKRERAEKPGALGEE
jgi:hypothetical protein